jgi:hypothetical protein
MRSSKLIRHFLPMIGCLGLVLPALSASDAPPAAVGPGQTTATDAPAGALNDVRTRAEAALDRTDLAAYRGWIKFLRFEADTAAARHGLASREAAEKIQRLADWVARLSANPQLLATLSGVQEWAYESPADGSGQPFKMAIPTDYDPARPPALSVYMHGYSGNHLEHSAGMAAHRGSFDLAVLGRGRAGGYRGLSEADVLHVIDYVQTHWAIDPDRINLNGGSMGGGGTYQLGSRYPHRWASGRPTCGYASHLPVANLITLPIYATHSDDDWTVSVLHDRGPLARLRELGGQAILDETTGYGHAVWDYKEGNQRGGAWVQLQVRPSSRIVRRIDYTAVDGGAMRGWWGEIVEWGAAPRPARFVLTAGDHNSLFAELTNIIRLGLRLAESPFDPRQPLQVSVNGAVPITLPAPLPAAAVLVRGEKGWSFESRTEPAPWRLHTPGSALLLYEGDPLLIVYGTQGGEAERKAMQAAAVAASKSASPAWLDDSGETGTDGVPHSQNLYGWLNIKADTAVTDDDIARCHLVLIGTATQNVIVARIASRLPVQFAEGMITCSDGMKFPGAHRALGLVHYNPLAPERLVFWVASENPATYAANSAIPVLLGGGSGTIRGFTCGADLLVMDATAPTLVAARTFDSRWRWTADRKDSPLVPASIRTHEDFAIAMGVAIRRAAGADLGMADVYAAPAEAPFVPGTTRVSDVMPLFYFSPVGVAEMSGAELAEAARRFAASGGSPLMFCQASEIKASGLKPDAIYRVAFPTDLLWHFSDVARMAPRNYRHTDLGVAEALERFLAGAGQ